MSEIRIARFADALLLADRLRFEDAREIAASLGVGTREGLFHCLLQSDRAYTLFESGQPAALWGVTGVSESGLQIGIPWLLAAEGLFEGNRAFLGQSRRVIRHLLLEYDVLTNLTDAANEAHLRWLGWCGFRHLRRHERHGPMGRPFLEFYQVNERRRVAGAAVRAVLERRPPPQLRASADDPIRRLVRAGVEVLDGDVPLPSATALELVQVLKDLEEASAAGARARSACAALVLEIAVHVSGCAGGGRALLRHEPLGGFLAAMANVADLLALNHRADGAPIVLALGSAREPPQFPGGSGNTASAAVEPVRGDGVQMFRWLIRRYVRMVTLEGRLNRIQGYRLWAAAIGVTEASSRRPLGIDLEALWDLMSDYRLAAALKSGGSQGMSELLERRRALLGRPLEHGAALSAMRKTCARGSRLDRIVAARLDEWPLAAAAAPSAGASAPSVPATIRTVADALAVASAVADRSSRDVLPAVRLGGVVSGYTDRHWLYRLLRHRLLAAAGDCDPADAGALLIDDVAGLLVTARLEDRLLERSDDSLSGTEVEALLRDALALWGPQVVVDDDFGYLIGLLSPAMAVPVAHGAQLAPALLVWHLAAVGRLDEQVAAVSDVLGDAERNSRRRYRKFLRRLGDGIDRLTFSRHLGMDIDVASETRRQQPHTVTARR